MSFFQKVASAIGTKRFLLLSRFYPPFFGAGIVVTHIDDTLRSIEVEMRLTPLNRNFLGTHFGGSLYAMADPFFVLMLLHNLGDGYTVWDKSATIEFKRPGRGRVRARFELSEAKLAEISATVQKEGKAHPRFSIDIVDDAGELVARVGKILSVRPRA